MDLKSSHGKNKRRRHKVEFCRVLETSEGPAWFDRLKLRLPIDTLRLNIDTMEQAGTHVREKEER